LVYEKIPPSDIYWRTRLLGTIEVESQKLFRREAKPLKEEVKVTQKVPRITFEGILLDQLDGLLELPMRCSNQNTGRNNQSSLRN